MLTFDLSLKEIIRMVFEVILLASVIYGILRVLRGSRGMRMLATLCVSLLALNWLSRIFNMIALAWISKKMVDVLPFFLLVVFQPEIRRVLLMLNVSKLRTDRSRDNMMAEENHKLTMILMPILRHLSESRTGALIAVEQEVGLQGICELGKTLNAPLTSDNSLLETIFYDGSPLHDGGVVIRGETIVAAGCVFPLCDADKEKLDPRWGMRHQAALGLSEQSDAVVLVVSEETGRISLAYNGKMNEIGENPERMRKMLNQNLHMVTVEDDHPIMVEIYRSLMMLGQQIRRSLGLMGEAKKKDKK